MTETPTQSPSAVVATRLKEARRVRGWSARELAERCAAAGASELTDNVIENIERPRQAGSGRQGRDVTIDQLTVLAYVLDIPPLALLLPRENSEYQVTPQVSASAEKVGRWLLGQRPLPRWTVDVEDPESVVHPGENFLREQRFFAELPPYVLGYPTTQELEERFRHMERTAEQRFEEYEARLQATEEWIEKELPSLKTMLGDGDPESATDPGTHSE